MPQLTGIQQEDLLQFPIFSDLSASELTEFLEKTLIKEYTVINGVILQEGAAGNGLAIILKGKVRIYKKDQNGEEHLLGVLKEGDFFGEMALLDTKTRSANVVALEDTTVLWMEFSTFQSFLDAHSPLIAKILTRMVVDLSRRLRLTDERYVLVKSYMRDRARA